jgi:DNA-binding YbaB/EbfC family protein
MKNPGMLMKGLAEMQKRMTAAQEKLAATDFDGDAAGGLVRVVINGKGELKGVTISPAVMDEGPDMLSDLVQAAYNVAFAKKEEAAKAVLGSLTTGLMPLGIKLPGLG